MIHLDIDLHELEQTKKLLKGIPFGFARAQKMAVKKALEAMRAEAVRQAQSVYYVKPSAVRKAIKLRAGSKATGGLFVVTGRRLNISSFMMSPKRQVKHPKGLAVAVKREGGMKTIRRGFAWDINRTGSAVGFMRTGPGFKGLVPITTLAIPQMMHNPDIQEAILERGEEAFMQSFRYWAGRAASDYAKLPKNSNGWADWTHGVHIPLPGLAHHNDLTGWH